MNHSLLQLFIVTVLGTSVFAAGLIKGLSEATALIAKVFSGTLSDYLGKRKVLAVARYALGAPASQHPGAAIQLAGATWRAFRRSMGGWFSRAPP